MAILEAPTFYTLPTSARLLDPLPSPLPGCAGLFFTVSLLHDSSAVCKLIYANLSLKVITSSLSACTSRTGDNGAV